MNSNRGINIDTAITVDGHCLMSCEVLDDEIQCRFGTNNTGLHFYFDWPGLLRFIHLLNLMMQRIVAPTGSTKLDFMVSVDGESEREHTPNCSTE